MKVTKGEPMVRVVLRSELFDLRVGSGAKSTNISLQTTIPTRLLLTEYGQRLRETQTRVGETSRTGSGRPALAGALRFSRA